MPSRRPAEPAHRSAMRTLYIDCFSGISGDMLLGALIDIGVSFEQLRREIEALGVSGFAIDCLSDERKHIHGTRFFVRIEPAAASGDAPAQDACGHAHGHRSLAEVEEIIERSPFSETTRARARAVFRRIAEAEGRIHAVPIAEVAFHEVGAIDSIVDILLGCRALELLAVEQILSSVPRLGHGFVECQHGEYPVPSAATLEILKGLPIQQGVDPFELVTPTGAAFLAEFVARFGPIPEMMVERIGYGIGLRDHPRRPNVLRLLLGRCPLDPAAVESADVDTVDVLETNLDDVTAECVAPLFDRLLEQGALDVTVTPVIMKKGRPGLLLSVLAPPERRDALARSILEETPALGVRWASRRRYKLRRATRTLDTVFGPIVIKLGMSDGALLSVAPEFASCAARAQAAGVPLKAVYQAALAAATQAGMLPGKPWREPAHE